MAYAFRIHEKNKDGDPAPVSATNMNGWSETGYIAGNLLGNIELGDTADRMGTSIPSVFARIFLFEGAFKVLEGATPDRLAAVNPDTRLVSDCLDLLEFLYQHGNDPKLVVKHWNDAQQIENLKHDGYQEHKKLAKVLEDEVALYPMLKDIFLFFWKDSTPGDLNPREFLIGGTSPSTLVFTSPNWRRCVNGNSFRFNRLNGEPMFGTSVEPLGTRDTSFKDMLYSLRMAYNGELTEQASSFNKYITTTWNNNGTPNPTANTPGTFMASFSHIADVTGAHVNAAALPLCYKQVTPTASGYEIIAKSDRYAHYTAIDGTNVNLQTPLALNANGLAGVSYIGHSVWDATTCKINEANVRTAEMHKRMLPGNMGVQYPFLIWSDFLEDKIIKLPYAINAQSFNVVFAGNSQYVLPLKRNFFKYFNVDDINEYACGECNKKLVEIKIDGDAVTVTVNVPISDRTHHVIALTKKYSGEDIVTGKFHLGFFPFYRCTANALNRYSVMNCSFDDTTLNFVSMDNLDGNVQASSEVRTPMGTLVGKTEYYQVNSAFDLVEVSVNNVRGLIIPKMQQVDMHAATYDKYKFAVDFGTSNTYIAYKSGVDIKTFETDVNQTVYLGGTLENLSKSPSFLRMQSYFAREFAPGHYANELYPLYPSRTAVCEKSNFANDQPNLFGNISIGFNMMHEPPTSLVGFVYKTGLKWLLAEHPGDATHTNRVKYYFLQTLWMLKNKSLMDGGDDKFEVYITFPEAMRAIDKNALMNLWDWAKNVLGIHCTFLWGTQYSESVAPYNCMAVDIGGSSYMNIDIGGGTNDLLFVNKDAAGHIAGARYSSSKFAADDLWGDGISVNADANLNNGFVDYVKGEILANDAVYASENIGYLKSLTGGIATSSADVMGYLFKYDTVFQTSAKITGQKNLYSLVFIHYAALMYNVARLIKKMDVDIPLNLSFTGMGSKYINLISSDTTVLKNLTKLLLQKYTGKNADKAFSIITAGGVDVKEITAKGVLTGLTLNPGFKIPDDKLDSTIDYGFDWDGNLTYGDVNTAKVRNAALQEFDKFVDSLEDCDFTNFISLNFGLTISKELIDDLKTLATRSFATMSASIPAAYAKLDVTETLFFWPLKNSLVELSKKYNVYR